MAVGNAEIDELRGKQRAAIVLIGLGTEKAAKIFKFLADEEVQKVVGTMSEIREITPDVHEQVMRDAYTDVAQGNIAGGTQFTKEVLKRALGERKAVDIISKVDLQAASFEAFRNVSPIQLVNVLSDEHPQTIALVLAHLEPAQASAVLSGLPEGLQADVTVRIARMDQADPEVIAQVEQVLRKQISSYKQEMRTIGGSKAVASILNLVDRSVEKNIMEKMRVGEEDLAEEVKNMMFIFEDIVMVEDKSMQRVLKEVDMNVLTLALKGASDEVKKKFFDNLSKRAVEMVKEELEYMGPVRLKVVEEAQQNIVNTVRTLEEQGEILITGRGGKEDEVII